MKVGNILPAVLQKINFRNIMLNANDLHLQKNQMEKGDWHE